MVRLLMLMMVMLMVYICWRIIDGETGVVKDVGALAEDDVGPILSHL